MICSACGKLVFVLSNAEHQLISESETDSQSGSGERLNGRRHPLNTDWARAWAKDNGQKVQRPHHCHKKKRQGFSFPCHHRQSQRKGSGTHLLPNFKKKYARFVLNNPMAYFSPIIAGKASGKASSKTCSVSFLHLPFLLSPCLP